MSTPRFERRWAERVRRRRRRLLRVDVASGLIVALLVVLLGPGLALIAIGALLVLVVSGASYLVGRLLARRRTRSLAGDRTNGASEAPFDYAGAGSAASTSRSSSTDW